MDNNILNTSQYINFRRKFYFNMYLFLISYKFLGLDCSIKLLKNFLISGGPLFIKLAQNLYDKNFLSDKAKRELKKFGNDNTYNEIDYNLVYYINTFNIKTEKKILGIGSVSTVFLGEIQKSEFNNIQKLKIIIKKNHIDIKNKIIMSIELFNDLKLNYSNYKFIKMFDDIIDYDELYNKLLFQADLNYEKKNILIMTELYKHFSDKVIIPKFFYSDHNTLIESFEEGVIFDEFIIQHPQYKYNAVNLLYCTIYHMIFNNFLHGDIHQCNLLFRLDDGKVKIIILDFGIVSKLKIQSFKNLLKTFQKNIYLPEFNKMVELMVIENINQNDEEQINTFRNKANQLSIDIDYENKKNEYIQEKVVDFNTGVLFKKILELSYECNFKYNFDFVNYLNTIILLEEYHVKVYNGKSGYKERLNFAKDNLFYNSFRESISNTLKN